MLLVPFGFGASRSSVFDPFEGFPSAGPLSFTCTHFPPLGEPSAFAAAVRIDWKETPEAHVFKADLPGMRKDEIKVGVGEEDGCVLQISGERICEPGELTDTWHRFERSGGKFLRRFRLPENAKMDGVTTAVANGVLTVTVPKKAAGQADVKSIEISG